VVSILAYRLRAEGRRRVLAWIGLALAMAVTCGVALAGAAGARRTASSYPRLLRAVSEQDAEVALPAPDGMTFNERRNPRLDAIDRFPQVAASARLYQLVSFDGDRLTASSNEQDLNALADGYGSRVGRPLLRSGRMPDPRRLDEALVDPRFAADHHLRVGSRFSVVTLDSNRFDEVNDSPPDYHGPRQVNVLTITGIGQIARDINPTTVLEDQPRVYVTQAFLDARAASLSNVGTAVKLRPGADVGDFQAAVNRYARAQHIDPRAVYFTAERDHTVAAERAARPEAFALALFALIVALAAFVVIGQALSRQVFIDGTDSPLLSSMGMTRHQRFALALSRVAVVTLVGAIGAVGVAIALSPLFPIGPARATEPTPGLAVDGPALAIGFVVVLAVFLGRGALPAWRQARAGWSSLTAPLGRDRPSALARLLARSGAGATSVVGVQMAFEPGRGRTSVPVRSALVTTTLAVVAVVAVTIFAGNLDQLVRTPASYGWSWTASTGFGFDPVPAVATQRLLSDRSLSAVGGGNYLDLHLGRLDVPAVTVDVLKGRLEPELLAGHAPHGDHDLVLGTQTMRAAGLHLGQLVKVQLNGSPATMRIVGRAVFPRLGAGIFTPTDLGQGAMLTDAAARKAGVDAADPSDPRSRYSVYLLQAAPGTSLTELRTQLNGQLAGTVPMCPGRFCVMGPQPPGDVVAYGRVRTTSLVLIALLGLIAAASLVHALVTSARRRQPDIAVLKMLGFERRQVAALACWQGLALTAAALLVGMPIGLILGRWSWIAFADQVGVASSATIPWVAILVIVPLTLALAVVVSVLPAGIARRTRPIAFLRPA
jgi:ABC-type lipoprotein release transport system permease subunit